MALKETFQKPRWVRDRKQFNRETLERIEVHIMELDKYLYKTHREIVQMRLDIRDSKR